MKLRLKNVRQHKSLELDIPDSGVILLQGKSGKGKTSVFDAIEECLFGSGSNIQTWGTKGYEIELELNNPKITIKRTKSPTTLTVNYEGSELKDDAAQGVINKALGMNEEEFLASSYIKQDQENSLLKYGPADQLRFIEALSLGGFNTKEFKKNIASKIKSNLDELESIESDIGYAKRQKQDLLDKIEKERISSGKEPMFVLSEEELNDSREIAEKLTKSINEINKDIQDCINQLTNEDAKKYKKNKELERDIKSRIMAASEELNALVVPDNPPEFEEVDETDKLRDQIVYLEIRSKIKDLASKIYAEYPDSSGKNLSSYLSEKLSEYSLKVDRKVSERGHNEQKLKELSALKKPQYCPECSAPLSVISGQIIKTTDVPSNLDEMKQSVSELIKSITSEILKEKTESEKLNKYISEASLLKKSLPEKEPVPGINSIDEAKKIILLFKQKETDYNKAKTEYDLSISKKLDLEKTLKLLGEKLSLIDTSVVLNEEEILNKQKELIKNKEALSLELDAVVKRLSEHERINNSRNLWLKSANFIEGMREEITKIDNNITKLEDDLKKTQEKWAGAKRLKELSDFASVQSIERTIDSINANAEEYINKMFPDDGTSIRLKNASQTKDGEERAKLSLEIFHKGQSTNKLSDFSGGEKSRASLSFQLGLAEMYGSPFLLVDEGFKGLGEDDKRLCLEVLKEVSKNRLVIAIEHGAPESFFDEVIYL